MIFSGRYEWLFWSFFCCPLILRYFKFAFFKTNSDKLTILFNNSWMSKSSKTTEHSRVKRCTNRKVPVSALTRCHGQTMSFHSPLTRLLIWHCYYLPFTAFTSSIFLSSMSSLLPFEPHHQSSADGCGPPPWHTKWHMALFTFRMHSHSSVRLPMSFCHSLAAFRRPSTLILKTEDEFWFKR